MVAKTVYAEKHIMNSKTSLVFVLQFSSYSYYLGTVRSQNEPKSFHLKNTSCPFFFPLPPPPVVTIFLGGKKKKSYFLNNKV